MTDQPFSDDVFKSLCEKLTRWKVDLTPAEQDLLKAILKIVWDVTGPSGSPEKESDPRFDGCFEPGQAALIEKYLNTYPTTTDTKSVDGAIVSRERRPGSIGQPPPPPAPVTPQQ